MVLTFPEIPNFLSLYDIFNGNQEVWFCEKRYTQIEIPRERERERDFNGKSKWCLPLPPRPPLMLPPGAGALPPLPLAAIIVAMALSAPFPPCWFEVVQIRSHHFDVFGTSWPDSWPWNRLGTYAGIINVYLSHGIDLVRFPYESWFGQSYGKVSFIVSGTLYMQSILYSEFLLKTASKTSKSNLICSRTPQTHPHHPTQGAYPSGSKKIWATRIQHRKSFDALYLE